MTTMYVDKYPGDKKYDAPYWPIFVKFKPSWKHIRNKQCRPYSRHYNMIRDLGAALREGSLPEAKMIIGEWDKDHKSYGAAAAYHGMFVAEINGIGKRASEIAASPEWRKAVKTARSPTAPTNGAFEAVAAAPKAGDPVLPEMDGSAVTTSSTTAHPTDVMHSNMEAQIKDVVSIEADLRAELKKANDRIDVLTRERDDLKRQNEYVNIEGENVEYWHKQAGKLEERIKVVIEGCADARLSLSKLHNKYDAALLDNKDLRKQCTHLEAELARANEKKPEAIKPELNLKEFAELQQLRTWVKNAKFTQQGIDKWREQAYFYGTTAKYLATCLSAGAVLSERQRGYCKKLANRIVNYYDRDYYRALVDGDAYIGERMRKFSRAWD